MLLLVFSWFVLAWLSLTLGVAGLNILSPLLRADKQLTTSIAPDYLLLFGFALTTFLVSTVSLFSPINWLVNAAFLSLGIFLHYQHRKSIASVITGLKEAWATAGILLQALVLVVVGVALSTVIIEVGETDTWFYHAQSIQWIKEYPAVPGLGNVHGRFAFNSNYFVISAFYAFWFTEENVLFPIFSFFFMVLNIRLLFGLQKSIDTENHKLFIIQSILLLVFNFQSIDLISSTSTDVISSILIIYICLLFLELFGKEEKGPKQLILWSIIALSVTFKLSSLLIVFLLLFLLPKAIKSRRIAVYMGTAVLIGLPFIIRNVILSGYLLYPFPDLDLFAVDWKIPIEEVQLEKDLVEGWAKQPYGSTYMEKFEDIPAILDLPFGEWLSVWWPAQSMKWKLFMLLSLLGIPLGILSWFKKEHAYAILFGTIFLNLLFWFDQAPQPRFAYGFLFFNIALILGYIFSFFLRIFHPKKLIFIAFLLFLPALFVIRGEIVFTPITGTALLYPTYETKIKTENFDAANFSLRIPSEEPPASIYWCYNAPLPCTPLPKQSLEMRGETFRQGFRVKSNMNSLSNRE